MAILTQCPECQRETFDDAIGQCVACGMLGTTDLTVNEAALAGLLHNVQLRLFDLQPQQFQEISGLFGPRPGDDEDDGIPFTNLVCSLCHQYLMDHGILCARISVAANGVVEHSLVIAPTPKGIERAIRHVRKLAMRARAVFLLIDPAIAQVRPDV